MSEAHIPVASTGWTRSEALALALVLTISAAAVPNWWLVFEVWDTCFDADFVIPRDYAPDFALLLLGLPLAIAAPRRAGLRFGDIARHWPKVIVVCGIPLLLTALVYPRLAERPFAGMPASMWLISPPAQDLLFMGVIYGCLEPHFGHYVHPRLPIRRVLPLGGLFFAAWHLPWIFNGASPGYVAFMCAYTFLGYTVVGLCRQWTGSVLYVTAAHVAGNYIAWAAN
jgi:membrane protease YdiL (CAAX protease family)